MLPKWLLALLERLLKPQPRPPVPPPTDPPPPPGSNELLDEMNRFRVSQGRQPYPHSPCLTQQALAYSQYLAQRGRPLTGGDHARYETRLSTCGIAAGSEILAQGYRDAKSLIAGWASSPGHRAAMLESYESCGVAMFGGYACGLMGDKKLFFTTGALVR